MTVTSAVSTPTAGTDSGRDPFVAALARYVEALQRGYPDGPDQMRAEALDAGANMRRMRKSRKARAA